MKFGVTTMVWAGNFDQSEFDLLPRIKEWGFDGVEIATFQPYKFPGSAVRKAIDASGLERTFCTTPGMEYNGLSSDPTVRRKTSIHLADCVKLAAEIGADKMIGVMYAPVGYKTGKRKTADEWKWGVELFQSLGDTLARHNVTICFEILNRFESFFIGTGAEAFKMAEEVNHPNVGILYDTFHGNIEEKNQAEGLKACGKWLRHVHTCENDRGIPGTGHTDWPGVFNALDEMKYDDWCVIESFPGCFEELAAAACIWRDIAPSQDAIAQEGLKFLKKCAADVKAKRAAAHA